MAMMVESIVIGAVLILMLLLILFLIILALKPWRYFSSSSSSLSSRNNSNHHLIKNGDLERPLVSEEVDLVRDHSSELARNYDVEGLCIQTEGNFSSIRTQGLVHKQRLPSSSPSLHSTQGDSLVVNVVSEPLEDLLIGQTLKYPSLPTNYHLGQQKRARKEDLSHNIKPGSENDTFQNSLRNVTDQGSSLKLEIISGPSRGLCCSIHSTETSRLPVTLGRVPPSDLLLKDSEVSGKHALVNWNLNKLKWELVDMGSLNGTLLNSQPVNHTDPESRSWGNPVELASGDVITVGTTSKVFVHITSETECQIPFGFGMASDPMALRRGGKKLPMEDVCCYQWPLPGIDKFGMFSICDGHGGAAAAKSATEILPVKVAAILSDSLRKEKVLSLSDASDVLKDAFYQTEASLNNYYEGCTATVLLAWADGHGNFFVQCANVGDSACVMSIDGKQIKLTEDHRITSYSERQRIEEIGEALKDGETRLCGLNLARMLGDKFLKQQEARFSSEPYISQVVHVDKQSKAFVVMASDGLWDVISVKKAIQLVLQSKENRHPADGGENSAEKVANLLLNEARTLRTKDNTSIIFLDFDTAYRNRNNFGH